MYIYFGGLMISYFTRNGIEYAKTDGKSVRIGSRVTKENQQYIGRVIDKENHVFCNRERGMFTYDPVTGEYGIADDHYDSSLKQDKRKKEKLLLDFGDVYFLDQLLVKTGYDEVLKAVGYQNYDTLVTMLMYYIISEKANSHAQTWYDGSIARILYPHANISSQRISDFLNSIGQEEKQQNYFRAHISWLKKHVCDDPAIIVDSTGLPNDIDTYLKDISNHNGKVSRESRMTVAVQRDSGYPLLYRLHPGNIVDCTTLQKTIVTLLMYDVETDLALLDAGYCTAEIMDDLLDRDIDFVTRLPESHSSLYQEVLSKLKPSLLKENNLMEFNGRYVYIARTEVRIGKKKRTAYAYLGYDVNRYTDEIHKAAGKPAKKKKSIHEMHDLITEGGYFIILSSLPYASDEILIVYYVRQLVEQYFDISKGLSKLIPLRGHSEDVIFGHLLLSQAAATMNLYIQTAMNVLPENRDDILMSLRNQKCTVYSTRIIPSEAQSKANEFYRKFGISSPVSFKRTKDGLIPQMGISL